MDDEIIFHFIGWQCDEKSNTDKVWTAFEINGNYYAGWGRRGKAIRFKQHSWSSLMAAVRNKGKKYDEVDKFELFTMFPNFEKEVASQLSFSILADKVL